MDNWTLNTKGRCGIPCYQKEIIISTSVRRSLLRLIDATPFSEYLLSFLKSILPFSNECIERSEISWRPSRTLMMDVFIYLRARRYMFARTIPYYHARKIKSVKTFDPLVGFWNFKKLIWLEFHDKQHTNEHSWIRHYNA